MAALSSSLVSRVRAVATAMACTLVFLLTASSSTLAQTAGAYTVTNLMSDGSVPATLTDANFINPWAISASGTWWISAAGTGYNYVVSTVPVNSFKVIVPSGTNPTANGFPPAR